MLINRVYLLNTSRTYNYGLFARTCIVSYYSTIYAISSGPGKSGVAVIRVSGEQSSLVITEMTKFKALPTPKMAKLTTIYDPISAEPLDKGIVLWFPGPRSFTGEDVCELHVHGSKAVIQAILLALSKLKNFRPAGPGEFTKRAFYFAKFDLTEVEGLSDLIDAETEMQRKQALYQMEGSLKEIYFNWRSTILLNLAHVEAYIDFSEDENIDNNVLNVVLKRTEELALCIQEHLNDFRKGEILRDGIKTVIIGSPNVGKSSLLNVFCQKPTAIVTELAGTTRDVVESTININGYPIVIADTAGIRKEGVENIVEEEGIRRSMNEAGIADVLLLVMDVRDVFRNIETTHVNGGAAVLRDEILSRCRAYKEQLGVEELARNAHCITILNKIDLLNELQKSSIQEIAKCWPELSLVSCKTEDGIADLLNTMSQHFQQLCGMPDRTNPSCTRTRHRYHLQQSLNNINNFLDLLKSDAAEENIVFSAEELRSAARNLGMITGAVATEEILDTIFKNFCIGK